MAKRFTMQSTHARTGLPGQERTYDSPTVDWHGAVWQGPQMLDVGDHSVAALEEDIQGIIFRRIDRPVEEVAAELRKMNWHPCCSTCGLMVLTDEEDRERTEWQNADTSIDGGEFSGGFHSADDERYCRGCEPCEECLHPEQHCMCRPDEDELSYWTIYEKGKADYRTAQRDSIGNHSNPYTDATEAEAWQEGWDDERRAFDDAAEDDREWADRMGHTDDTPSIEYPVNCEGMPFGSADY